MSYIEDAINQKYNTAVNYYNNGYYRQAYEIFVELASKNYHPAIYMKGVCQRDGLGTPADINEAAFSFVHGETIGSYESHIALEELGNFWDLEGYQRAQGIIRQYGIIPAYTHEAYKYDFQEHMARINNNSYNEPVATNEGRNNTQEKEDDDGTGCLIVMGVIGIILLLVGPAGWSFGFILLVIKFIIQLGKTIKSIDDLTKK